MVGKSAQKAREVRDGRHGSWECASHVVRQARRRLFRADATTGEKREILRRVERGQLRPAAAARVQPEAPVEGSRAEEARFGSERFDRASHRWWRRVW